MDCDTCAVLTFRAVTDAGDTVALERRPQTDGTWVLTAGHPQRSGVMPRASALGPLELITLPASTPRYVNHAETCPGVT